MFIINNIWGGKLLNFRDDPTGLGILASVQLRLPTDSFVIKGTYWPVPGNQKDNSLRLEDKLQRWLRKEKIMVSPRQYMMNAISQQLVKHQTSNATTIVTVDFNSKWGLNVQHRSNKAFNSWTEAAGLVTELLKWPQRLKSHC